MLEIITATAQDRPLIEQLAHKTWPATFGTILSEAQIAYMLDMMYSQAALSEQMEQAKHVFLLVKDETGFLGYASYELNYGRSATTKIHKIYVLPSAQGKGVGKRLMEHIATIAQAAENGALSLNVNRDNPAIQFYKEIGFQKVAEENIPIGNGFWMEDFVMVKPL